MERAMGIEPTALAWEARVLPLYDARSEEPDCTHGRGGGQPARRGKLRACLLKLLLLLFF